MKVRGTIAVPEVGGVEARLHSLPPFIILKPGGPPKLGRQVARASKGAADVSASKLRAKVIMIDFIMIKINADLWVWS